MSLVVLDASAAAELVTRTSLGQRLLALAPRDRTWWAPDLFHVETAGAIRRMRLNGLIDEVRATHALERLLALPVTVARSRPLVPDAWVHRHNLTIQDAVYVALAQHLDAPLLTGDRRIAGAPNLPVQVLHMSATD